MEIRECKRCGHTWCLRKAPEPVVCPKCKNAYWNKDRITKGDDIDV